MLSFHSLQETIQFLIFYLNTSHTKLAYNLEKGQDWSLPTAAIATLPLLLPTLPTPFSVEKTRQKR